MWHKSLFTNIYATRVYFNSFQCRCISLAPKLNLDQKWRRERALPLNPNSNGALTDGPDYTFLDGRPTPYGVGQRNRILKERDIAQKIIELTAQIDYAVARYDQIQQEKSQAKKEIIAAKLKPKGQQLLTGKKE